LEKTRGEGNAIAAIEAAMDDGAHIINYSHGFNPKAKVGNPPWIWPTKSTDGWDANKHRKQHSRSEVTTVEKCRFYELVTREVYVSADVSEHIEH
jgi:hypothetical protein